MAPRHLPVLDGLRAIAVLLVLWCHVPETMPGYPEWLRVVRWFVGPGGLGVEIFFVLSGFLITRILLAEREQQRPVKWFLVRRLLRIFPIYYLLLAVMLPSRPAGEIGWCALYLYNVRSIFWPEGGPLEHTWSLCIEEHFYLLWPLCVAFLSPAASRRWLVYAVMPAALVGAWLVSEFVPPDRAMTAVQHGSPFRFLGLGAGCLLAFHEGRLGASPSRVLLLALVLVAASVLVHPWWVFVRPMMNQEPPWLDLRYGPLLWLLQQAALCTGIVLLAILAGRRFPRNPLTAAPLRAVGRISYGLYLYHLPIFFAVLVPQPSVSATVLAIGLSFAAAALSYFVIEAPIQRFAARFRAPSPAPG